VLPSGWEAFGLVLVESLASGTPVVSTDAGGMREIVTDPAVGRLVPHRDHEALAAAIAQVAALAADPATPARCAAHARRWGWTEAVGPAHEALYRSIT
jgi:glycosyltransferase involved in cell wall biosynthesis